MQKPYKRLNIMMFSRQLVGLMLLTCCAYQSCAGTQYCPTQCKCSSNYEYVNCKGRGLHTIPTQFPPTAVHIDLSQNQLTVVSNDSFTILPNLTILDLSHNKITDINTGALIGCGSLAVLHLANNKLTTLQTSTFYKTTNLRILDVSQNQLKAVPRLGSVSNLEHLYLEDNRIQSFFFPDGYRTATSLSRIALSNNALVTTINSTDFQSLSNAVKLSRLYMSRCSISKVEPHSFAPFAHSLASLRLSQNPIGADTLQTILQDFANSKSLKSLDLSDIGLHDTVKNTTFTVLGNDSRLASLDLSRNLRLSNIQTGVFSLLQYLTTLTISGTGIIEPPYLRKNQRLTNLDLSSNSISRYVSSTRFPAGLTRLRLNGNSIAKLVASPFGHLHKLTLLTLNDNNIHEFGSKSLDGLSSLNSLDLSDNSIHYLPNGIFDPFGRLSSLDLSKNKLKFLNTTVFSNTLGLLAKLDLSGNGMSYVHPLLFSTLWNLTQLNLSKNKLGTAFADPRLGSYKGFLSGLNKLQVVDMSSNEIGVLPAQMISGTSQLDTLNLGTNNIFSWDSQHTFKGSIKLKKLLLNSNRLALFNKTSFSDLHNLTILDLTDNPFACTCDMRQFRDWLKTTKVNVSNSQTYSCASPPYLLGTRVVDYDMSAIQCLPQWIWILIGVGAGMILLLAFICIMYRYRWKIRYSMYKCRARHTGCCSNRSNSDQRLLSGESQACRYAAFLSQCSKDVCRDFLDNDILPRIDNNTEFSGNHGGDYPIVHQGLYDPCKHIIENLDEALTASAATIVFICKHYSADRRAELELQESFHLQELNHRSIIVILSEEGLPLRYVPRMLHSVVSSSAHIEWKEGDRGCIHRLNGKLAEVWTSDGGELDESTD